MYILLTTSNRNAFSIEEFYKQVYEVYTYDTQSESDNLVSQYLD